MKLKNYEFTPSYGFIRKEYTRFNDTKLLEGNSAYFTILKKIKLWYGTPKNNDNYLDYSKVILGIECQYRTLGGKTIKADKHCSPVESDDVEVKELELDNNDYFCKFFICSDDIIYYIKLESFKGKTIEIGQFYENISKNPSFNGAKSPHIIQTFYGFHDNVGLRALGFGHTPKINMYIINFLGILRLRHMMKHNEKQKNYWSNENNIKKLDLSMKAIIKLAFLPDGPFASVFKYFC